jgi:hypothetical protein
MAIINEMRSGQASVNEGSSSNTTDMFLASVAKQNLTALLKAVERLEVYWAGVSYVANVLEKRKSRLKSSG